MEKQKGITLIALVITIIVLLILAGVSLSLVLGDNGIINKAQNSKLETEIAEEKEILNFSVMQAKGEKFNENINEDKLREALNNNSKEGNKAVITEADDESIIVKFEGSKRYYDVKNDNTIFSAGVNGGEKKLTIKCVDSNKTVLDTKTYTVLKNQYSKDLPTIDGYIASQEKISGEITGDTTKEVVYYKIILESQIVFTGLNSNGNVTTDSSQIVSYMIGNNSSTRGNGLV